MGSILGDGCLETSKWGSTRLQFKQSVEKQEYIFWLYGKMGNLCRSAPKQNKIHQWYFSTRYSNELTFLKNCFYRGKTKIVPKNIVDFLQNPISLAIWFMDDGTLDWRAKDHYAFRLTTNCFTFEENKVLVEALKKKFGVDATVQKTTMRGNVYPRIHIGVSGRDTFLQLVKPFILDCFRHKVPPFISNPPETWSTRPDSNFTSRYKTPSSDVMSEVI